MGQLCYKQSAARAILHTWFFRPILYLDFFSSVVVILLTRHADVRYWVYLYQAAESVAVVHPASVVGRI